MAYYSHEPMMHYIFWEFFDMLGVLIPFVAILFLITFIRMMMKHYFGPVKIYALLVSAAAMIAGFVSLAVGVYSTLQMKLISEEEYLLTRGGNYFDEHWCKNELGIVDQEIPLIRESLENNTEAIIPTQPQPTKLTAEQRQECKDKQKQRDLAWRNLSHKETVIGASTWFVVSLLVLMVHVPLMRRKKNCENEAYDMNEDMNNEVTAKKPVRKTATRRTASTAKKTTTRKTTARKTTKKA